MTKAAVLMTSKLMMFCHLFPTPLKQLVDPRKDAYFDTSPYESTATLSPARGMIGKKELARMKKSA